MRRVVIAAAAAAVLGLAAGCGGDEEEPETPETPAAEEEAGSASPPVAEQWESAGELDNMPAEASAELEPPVSTQVVVDAFMNADLADGRFVDLGADLESCDVTDCVQAFSIGKDSQEVAVMLYMSDEMAAAAAEQFGDAHVDRSVVLHYGYNETPEDIRESYETTLAEALAE